MLRTVVIIAIATMTMTVTVNAQQAGKAAVGAQLGVGSGPSFVLGGKVQYGITDPIRLEASLSGLWGKKTYSGIANVNTSGYDLSMNVHYLFLLGDRQLAKNKKTPLYVYPLAGVGIYKITAKANLLSESGKNSETKVGMNIGGGIEQYLSNEKFSWFMEHKLGLGKDLSRYTGLWGMAYHF